MYLITIRNGDDSFVCLCENVAAIKEFFVKLPTEVSFYSIPYTDIPWEDNYNEVWKDINSKLCSSQSFDDVRKVIYNHDIDDCGYCFELVEIQFNDIVQLIE